MPKREPPATTPYESLPYGSHLHFEPEDQIWVIRYPDLPGCVAHGATRAEALKAGEVAKVAWLTNAAANGEELPELRHEPTYSGKFVFRLPRSLHRHASETATEEGVSLNTYLVQLVTEGVERSGQRNFLRYLEGIMNRFFRVLSSQATDAGLSGLRLSVEPIFGTDRAPVTQKTLVAMQGQEAPRKKVHG